MSLWITYDCPFCNRTQGATLIADNGDEVPEVDTVNNVSFAVRHCVNSECQNTIVLRLFQPALQVVAGKFQIVEPPEDSDG